MEFLGCLLPIRQKMTDSGIVFKTTKRLRKVNQGAKMIMYRCDNPNCRKEIKCRDGKPPDNWMLSETLIKFVYHYCEECIVGKSNKDETDFRQ